MNSTKRILVTGAFGNIGEEVLLQLVKSGNYEITAFDLPSKHAEKLAQTFSGKIKTVFGDITNISDVKAITINQDVVIHLAAIIPPLAFEQETLTEAVNVGGTKNLIAALENYSPDAHILYSSSVAIYGDRNEAPWITVSDPFKISEGDNYAPTKVAAEKIIQNSSINYTIVRLAAVMGYGNHKVDKIMFCMPLATDFEFISIKDAASVFVNAIEKLVSLKGNIYNAGGGPSCRLTYKELLIRSFDIYGLGQPKFGKNCFATHNWHAAYYKDGDTLEDILHFRSDTKETYFKNLKKSVPPLQRIMTKPFSPVIKYFLGRLSEPKKAIKNKDQKLINRFFKNGQFE